MNLLFAHLLEAAQRAPSAHNTQPWLLAWHDDELQVSVSAERVLAVADPENADVLHALGALLENLFLTLAHLGFEGEYHVAKNLKAGEPVVSLRWQRREGMKSDSQLYQMIPIRRTSRLKYSDEMITTEAIEEIKVAASSPCRLHVLTDLGAITEIRRLAARASSDSFSDSNYVEELYRWMRFSRGDKRWCRDGLNAECMGWNRFEAVVIRQLLKPSAVRMLSKFGLANFLFGNVEQQAPSAPSLCLLTTRDTSPLGRIEAGRTLQRTWLTAAAYELVTHPLSAAIDKEESRARVLELFGADARETPVNLFRLGKSATVARSARLPADELVARTSVIHPATEERELAFTKAGPR